MASGTGPKKSAGWLIQFVGVVAALMAARPVCAQQTAGLAESTRALYRGDYGRAAALAADEIRVHPEDPAARILLARAEIAQGKFESAYQELRRVHRADPKNIDALYYLGRLCGILSQTEFQRLFALAPDSARVHQLLAESYQAQEDKAKAEEEYQAALKADPRSIEVLDALGDLVRFQFRFDEAISYYSQANKIAPHDYDSTYGLGASFLYRQDVERAIEQFRLALDIDPNSAAARLALGDALLRTDKPTEAVRELRAALTLEPAMRQAYTLLARAYQKLNRSAEAEAALKKANELTQREIESRESLLVSDELIPSPLSPKREPNQPQEPNH